MSNSSKFGPWQIKTAHKQGAGVAAKAANSILQGIHEKGGEVMSITHSHDSSINYDTFAIAFRLPVEDDRKPELGMYTS